MGGKGKIYMSCPLIVNFGSSNKFLDAVTRDFLLFSVFLS